MKRFLALLLIFMLLLSGCKRALPDEDTFADTLVPGDGGADHSETPDEEPVEPAINDEYLPDDEPALTAPENPEEESVVWYASIRRVDEYGFLANHLKNPDYGLFNCAPAEGTEWLGASDLQDLKAGDVVAITFDGSVEESYPAGISWPDSIERISDPLETYLEQERSRLEKNTVHIYDFRVILKEYPLYDYTEEIPMEKPDFSAVSPIGVKEERIDGDPDEDGGSPFTRVLYITKQAKSVDAAIAVLKELMAMPEVLQAWAVPCATA